MSAFSSPARLLPVVVLLFGVGSSSALAQVPISFTLDHSGYVTLVIDSVTAAGDTIRVHNLIQEEYYSDGSHTVYWDGYDFGEVTTPASGSNGYEYERRVIPARDYLVRGLVHDGIRELHEFDVYTNKAAPPWKTTDGSGAWLSDHSTPYAADFVIEEDGSPRIYVGSITAEEGHRGISTTLDGQKIFGKNDFGHSVAGPIAFAQDANSQEGTVLALQVWDDNTGFRWETPLLFGGTRYIEAFQWRLRTREQPGTQGAKNQLFDVVRWNDTGIFSATAQGILVFVDLTVDPGGTEYYDRTESPAYIGEIDGLDTPRGLAFENDSTLLVVTGSNVERWSIDRASGTGQQLSTVVSGLDEPQDVEVANDGTIYVALHGSSHQIWAFDSDGNKLREIGNPGGAQLGAYNEARMSKPRGFSIVEGLSDEYSEYNNRLYVAEASFAPKRVSVWTTDGTFLDAWYGSPKYSGGGELLESDKSRFFYGSGHGTIEFELDWSTGDTRPSRLLMLPTHDLTVGRATEYGETNSIGRFPRRYAPQTPIEQNGELYVHDSFSATENSGVPLNTIWMYDSATERLLMTTAFGLVGWGDEADWSVMNEEPIYSDWRGIDEGHRVMFNWTDLDGDEQADPSEFSYAQTPDRRTRLYITDELGITTSDGRLFTPSFDGENRPRYDPSESNYVVDVVGQNAFQYYDFGDGTGQIVPTGNGYVQDAGPIVGYNSQGLFRWRYHNQWPTNNSGSYAPIPQFHGQLVRMGALLTPKVVSPLVGESGPLWGINGYYGSMHLITHDGFYLAELGADKRISQRFTRSTEARGVDVSGYTPSDEHYWPTFQQTADGNVYLVSGKESSRISRVDGLGSIRRLQPWTVTVTSDMVDDLDDTQTVDDSYAERPTGTASSIDGVVLDGYDGDWDGANWLPIDATRSWHGAVAYTDTHLFGVWDTDNPSLLTYSGGELTRLFADGGSLEIGIGVNKISITEDNRHSEQDNEITHEPIAGDLRVVMTREDDPETGPLRAMLYEQVSDTPENTTTYESPIRILTLDRVLEISDDVELVHSDGTYEVKIALDALGFAPSAGDTTVFEIGVIEGSDIEATRRTYWGNKTELHTSDLPSEAEVLPYRWGDLAWNSASTESSNQPPSVTLSGIEDDEVRTMPTSVELSASATDADGSIQKLSILVNGDEIASAESASTTATWTPDTTGHYRVTAHAYDDVGSRGHTDTRTVHIHTVQEISLHEGWNLVSSRIRPASDSLATVFSDIEDDLEVIQLQNGDTYDPERGTDAIGQWQPGEAYRIYMRAPRTLRLQGIVASVRIPSLQQGWNVVPYTLNRPMPAETAFGSIREVLEIVKDESGAAYIPSRDVNEIDELIPGRAYKVYVRSPTSFSFP